MGFTDEDKQSDNTKGQWGNPDDWTYATSWQILSSRFRLLPDDRCASGSGDEHNPEKNRGMVSVPKESHVYFLFSETFWI